MVQSWCLSCFAVQLVHYIHLSDVSVFFAFVNPVSIFSSCHVVYVLFVNMTTCTPAEGKI